jgi:hypothetical protein
LTVTRKKVLDVPNLGGNGGFAQEMGTIWGSGRYDEGHQMPNSCPTSHYAQTPVTLRQEKVSPNAKNP